ncbi:SAV_6107 family HEPN domain-containing protein [Amycolatopsis sp.]|uniref:SAV_6107 family HEPN domain-containing protein n=1 Tax=Amycolatopsis sp. TaxID=37632 RepID=UPI0039C85B06
MSVKVVSPTDPGQPELPMSLRPQPTPAVTTPRGRSRQCLAAPAADPRQPQLPIALCPSAAELRHPSSVAASSTAAAASTAEPAQSELPLPVPEIPEQTRPLPLPKPPATIQAGSGRPAGVDSGQLELPSPGQPQRPAEPSPTIADASELAVPDPSAPAAGPDGSELPAPVSEPARPAAAGSGAAELPTLGDSAQAGPAAAEMGSGVPVAPAAGAGRSELSVPVVSQQSRPAAASAPAAVGSRPVAADASDLPVPDASASVPAPAAGADRPQLPSPASEPAGPAAAGLPVSLRPPAAAGEADQSALPMSLRPPASPAAAGLLAQARRGLAEAAQESRPAERFIGAYLAALRGAAAVLAARGRPHRGRARPASTWVLLDSVAPELREWSAFFASNSATRAAAQAGITGKVTAESADGLVGAATPFLELVRRLVHGLPITGEAHVA